MSKLGLSLSSLVSILLLGGATLAAPEPDGVHHPLEATIRSLAKASTELSAVSSEGSSDKDLQAEVELLKKRVSNISSEALVAPIHALEPRLSKMGFEFKLADQRTNIYEFARNSSFNALQEDAKLLKSAKWVELENLIVQNQKDIKAVVALADDAQIKKTLSSHDYNSVYFQSAGRRDALDTIRENADSTLECISFYTKISSESGLKIIENTPNNFAFSSEDLMLKYGVKKISELQKDQKRSAKQFLKKMADESIEYQGTCVSVEAGAFFLQQSEAL